MTYGSILNYTYKILKMLHTTEEIRHQANGIENNNFRYQLRVTVQTLIFLPFKNDHYVLIIYKSYVPLVNTVFPEMKSCLIL